MKHSSCAIYQADTKSTEISKFSEIWYLSYYFHKEARDSEKENKPEL